MKKRFIFPCMIALPLLFNGSLSAVDIGKLKTEIMGYTEQSIDLQDNIDELNTQIVTFAKAGNFQELVTRALELRNKEDELKALETKLDAAIKLLEKISTASTDVKIKDLKDLNASLSDQEKTLQSQATEISNSINEAQKNEEARKNLTASAAIAQDNLKETQKQQSEVTQVIADLEAKLPTFEDYLKQNPHDAKIIGDRIYNNLKETPWTEIKKILKKNGRKTKSGGFSFKQADALEKVHKFIENKTYILPTTAEWGIKSGNEKKYADAYKELYDNQLNKEEETLIKENKVRQ